MNHATLNDYQKLLGDKDCRWCRKRSGDEVTRVHLGGGHIENYDHSGGYNVHGFQEKQWLYVECPTCNYQWSFVKLGIQEIGIAQPEKSVA